jgi:hypothetical protein
VSRKEPGTPGPQARPGAAAIAAPRAEGFARERRKQAGGLVGARTRDLQIKSPLLYQLSYEPLSSLCEAGPLGGSSAAINWVPAAKPGRHMAHTQV